VVLAVLVVLTVLAVRAVHAVHVLLAVHVSRSSRKMNVEGKKGKMPKINAQRRQLLSKELFIQRMEQTPQSRSFKTERASGKKSSP